MKRQWLRSLLFSGLALTTCVPDLAMAAPSVRIHPYAAGPNGAAVNAYLVETATGVVAVDATLTVDDATEVRRRIDAIGKPLRAILLTHGHPDHYNGAHIVRGDSAAPIIATAAVDAVIRRDDAHKEQLWRSTFGAQWPAQRAFPTQIVRGGETVKFDGVAFTVYDLGPGESHVDNYWILATGGKRYAFIGDVVLNHVHAYLSDGHSTQWLENLDKMRPALAGVARIYPGHGAAGGIEMLSWQRKYLEEYRGVVQRLQRNGRMSAAAKSELVSHMRAFLPNDRLAFAIELGADPIASEVNVGPYHRTFETIKAQVPDPYRHFILTVDMKIKDGVDEQFIRAFARAITYSRDEEGCLTYTLARSTKDRSTFLLYERWTNLAALKAHIDSEAYAKLLGDVSPLLQQLEVKVLMPDAE